MTKTGLVKALLILAFLILAIIITGKLDENQAEKEKATYIQLEQAYPIQTEAVKVEETPETIPDLKGLMSYYESFKNASQKYDIDINLLIAISALESGWGTSYYAQTNNNIFGWCSGEMRFNSVDECINHVAEFMATEYLSPTGMYYEGTGIEDIAIHYNESPQEWAREVKKIYENLGGNENGKV